MSSYSYRLATTEYRIKKKKRIEFKNHKRNYFPYFVFSLILSSTTTANVHYSLNNILDYQRVTNTTDNTSLILYIRQTYRTYFYTNTHTHHIHTLNKKYRSNDGKSIYSKLIISVNIYSFFHCFVASEQNELYMHELHTTKYTN